MSTQTLQTILSVAILAVIRDHHFRVHSWPFLFPFLFVVGASTWIIALEIRPILGKRKYREQIRRARLQIDEVDDLLAHRRSVREMPVVDESWPDN